MSAAAIGAAGAYAIRRRNARSKAIKPKAGEVRSFARMLQERFGLSSERAWQLAEEQAQKIFPRALRERQL